MKNDPSTASAPKTTAPGAPISARLLLTLFTLSLVFAGFSAWVWLSADTAALYRRGYTPLTAEWQTDGEGAWVADPYIGKKLRCDLDARESNELGREFTYRAVAISPDACFRDDGINGPVFAVAVGDSFTFGHKVALEDVWTERLEKAIGADVVNLGLSGGAPTQYLRNYVRHGAPLKPRLVIMTLFVNDWLDDAMFHAWWQTRQTYGEQVDFPRSNAIYEGIRKNAYRLPPDWAQPALGGGIDLEIEGETYHFDASAYAAQDPRSPTIAEGKRRTEQAIIDLRAAAVADGATLVCVVIPAKEHVYHDRLMSVLPYARELPADTFCREITEWCRKHDIACLDMLPILRRDVAAGGRPYFPRDGHFREQGNHLLARELERCLRELQLIQPN